MSAKVLSASQLLHFFGKYLKSLAPNLLLKKKRGNQGHSAMRCKIKYPPIALKPIGGYVERGNSNINYSNPSI